MALDRLTQITSVGIVSGITLTGITTITELSVTSISATSATIGSAVTIDSSGINVGVITAASFIGNVTGNVNSTGLSTFSGGLLVGTGASISSPAENTLTLGTNNSETFRINSSGNIGIGTTNPTQKLDVNGNINLLSSGNYIQKTFADNTEEYILRGPTLTSFHPTISYRRSSGTAARGFIFGSHDNNGSRADWMSIWNGSVGIGTTNPGALLHVSGGNIKVDNGYGIDFSATANSFSTMTSELLSDYEEGTWSPTLLSGGTVSSINEASYTRIGRLVTVYFYINLSSIPNNGNSFQIGSLPYTSRAGSHYSTGQIGYCGTFNLSPWRPLVMTGNSYIYFHRIDGSNLTLLNSGATGLSELLVSVWYHAA